MKWLAILFTLFILLVIVLADTGQLAQYVGFVYEVPWGDKAGHFILYGILTLLLNLALFRALPHRSPKRVAAGCGLILALLIGLEEFSQQYFASRTFDLVDLACSYAGVICFSALALVLKK
jgi:VanZ family protein